jgi:nitrite reductase/ring-hydroxylating ferredoxin subunit
MMRVAAKLAELPPWSKKLVTIEGREVLLVNTKGEVFACEPECPHQGAPLSGALLKEADHITCARHGWHFNLKSGVCREFPDYLLRVYPVQIAGDDILVDVG